MHTGVIVSMRSTRGWEKRCVMRKQAAALPSGLPWRLQCNIQAYAASQPSGGGRGEAHKNGTGEGATVVMASGMHAWGGS
jgi:hypothetical protein